MKIFCFFIIFGSIPHAYGKVMVGPEVSQNNNEWSFSSAENNFFSGEYQYGVGHARLVLGEDYGVRMRSAGGMIMTSSGDLILDDWGIFVSLDTGNVSVNWTKNEKNHYTLGQGVGSGLFLNWRDYQLVGVIKGGTWITNYDSRKFLQPQLELFYGYQFVLKNGHLGLSYDLMRSRDQVLWSVAAQYRDWSIRHEHNRGGDIWLVMVDLEFF